MSNAIFLTPEAGDGGVIVEESSGSASMPASNLLKIQPTDRWRSTGLNPAFFELDLGTDWELDTAALLYTNASNTATYRIRVADTKANLLSAPAYDSGSLTHWPQTGLDGHNRTHAFHAFSSAVTKRWVRVDVTDSSNADGYYEMGRFYIGKRFVPTLNIDWGSQFPMYQEDKVQKRAQGGLVHPIQRPRRRVWRGNFTFHSEVELNENFQELTRLRGVSQDLLFVLEHDGNYPHNGMICGLLSEPMPVRLPEHSTYELSAGIEEML